MNRVNAISDMIQKEEFNAMSQIAIANNEDVEDVLEEEPVDCIESETDDELEDGIGDETQTDGDGTSYVKFMRELGIDSFNDKEEFVRAIKLYNIKTHKHFEVVESRPDIWSIKCKLHKQGCKWKLRACKHKRSGCFDITKYTGPHTCLHSKITQDHPNLDASLIAQEIQHLIKEQPSISISALRAEVIDKLGYTPSYKKVWLGKQKAIERVFGDWDESYIILPKFMEALKKFNPGTIAEWCVLRRTGVEQVEFRRVFWAFNPSILGFKHCRPVISIDATHLYGKYKGKLMIAMGVDGNNQILPLAFAIVENESYASWSWFLSHVKKHVVKDTKRICLISDRHAGILKAVNEQGSPWYCLMHFINNFNDKFRNSQLKALAYRAGSQNQIRKFNSIMEEIGKINRKARQWLEQHAFDKWTLAHDGRKRYGLLTTNLSEIFNSVLKVARFLPITSCVQLTFYRLVHYFDVRRPMGSNAQDNGDMYTPHILAKQAASMSKAGAHSLRLNAGYLESRLGYFRNPPKNLGCQI
ncbi:uncharacterized protein LOC110914388 [Helianthus annuus]|uniref:uncharacterized protein LOC110914388 n=1 Tax=Helianthus annuus TaxID=4232 RepID=UPI00165322FA|nr:uncharacterized protein LOC110914388 [Helianthus annuus]